MFLFLIFVLTHLLLFYNILIYIFIYLLLQYVNLRLYIKETE